MAVCDIPVSARTQQTLVGMQALCSSTGVTPTKKLGSWDVTLKPQQKSRKNKPKGTWVTSGYVHTQDDSTIALKSEAPSFEELLLVLHSTLVANTPATSETTPLAPVAAGTGFAWTYRLRNGARNTTLAYTIEQGDSDGYYRVENVRGTSMSMQLSTSGEERKFDLSAQATGGVLRTNNDGLTPALTTITAGLAQLPDAEIEPENFCVYVSHTSKADLVKRHAEGTTTPLNITSGTLQADIQAALEALGCFDAGDVTVTVTGTAGASLQIDITMQAAGAYQYQNLDLFTIAASAGWTGTGTPTIVEQQSGNGTTTVQIQRITFPNTITGGSLLLTASGKATVRLQSLSSFSLDISDRVKTWKPIHCGDRSLPVENLSNKVSLKYMADLASRDFLKKNRGAGVADKRMWFLVENIGTQISAGVNYGIQIWGCFFLDTWSDIPLDSEMVFLSLDGELTDDDDFHGVGSNGFLEIVVTNTQSAILTV